MNQPQRVLITAAASGIGHAIAEAFHAAGAQVFICDIDMEALARVRDELPGVHIAECDMSQPEAIAGMIQAGTEALGGLDVLVNNAGISGPTLAAEDLPLEQWEQVVQINLNGTFYTTQRAIPHLKQSAAGVIINMSSAAGRFGYPNRSPYCATKWGLLGLTKTLAMELGEYDIRVNAIAPGAVKGERIHHVLEGRAEQAHETLEQATEDALAKQSLKHFVDPANIGALAVFLASDAAQSISGQILPIDGDLQSN
ncbi:SDR family oxidoreductase [Salinisphaera sp.]|uniref:SDR family oxidoreductase n=1 Tax=Salinisphaera sp. TaxID=1914330 RepID=UPI002D79E512|nr:SDR family oxidoreductase [Salinisphaera sp.]HET7314694.1 SDR family oxidoreductase [Salinisphaera sp.]